jgi:hypothetical protein
LIRPYLLALATRPPTAVTERLEALSGRADDAAAGLAPLAPRIEAMAGEIAALKSAVAELTRAVEAWGVAGGDLRAVTHRLADLEDELIELRQRPPG